MHKQRMSKVDSRKDGDRGFREAEEKDRRQRYRLCDDGDRTFINTWEDRKVVNAVKATGRRQLIIAGLWTEICVAMPVIQALGEGWDVTVIADASGGTSVEAHEVAIQRMIAAGANMMTWLALASEWQRDWARTEHVGELTEVLKQHAAGSGIAYLWEQQLLNTPVPSTAG
ncbi:isochorismatase family protein [Mesorhizobium sp. M0518]|nr:isochorismatase family protein [Mesorhizobium sp. M7A.F.Ca.US.010.02.1.1]